MAVTQLLLFSLGIAALALPLWLHLRLGRVKKRAVVSSLRLLRATPQASRSPRRLVDVPLFLLRSLMFLLLALGFGRLVIPRVEERIPQVQESEAEVREYAAFVLDVSGSMHAMDGEIWEAARARTLEELGKLSHTSHVAIVLSPAGQVQAEWETPELAMQRVRALEPGYGANRISSDIRKAVQMLSGMPEDLSSVLHIVSDFQHSSLVGIDRCVIPAHVNIRVTKIGPEQLPNRGVVVSVQSAGATDIGVYGFSDGTGGFLTLEENGNKIPLEISTDQEAVRYAHMGEKREWITRELTLDKEDSLLVDNVAWDVFRAQEPVPVWLWEPSDAQRVFDQISYYVNRGLQPSAEETGGTWSRYQPVTLLPEHLSSQSETPRLLVIPATPHPPDALPGLAESVMRAGGSVIVFGGPEWDANAFRSSFGSMTGIAWEKNDAISFSPTLANIEEDHPLWGELDAVSRRELAKAPLRHRHQVSLSTGTRVLAEYADGIPFVVEKPVGRGHCYFLNTSADRAWGDWPASAPLFVPALHLLAARALHDVEKNELQGPVFVGQPVTLWPGVEYAGRSLEAGGRVLPIDGDGKVADVVFEKPGVSDLILDDGTYLGRVAIHFPPAESTLESDSQSVILQRLESLREEGAGSLIRWEEEGAGSLIPWEEEEAGGQVWRLCLVLVALLAVMEPLIADRRIRV